MNKWFATFFAPFLALAAVLASSLAIGQSWPQRPVKVIVPFPPGGNSDIQARIVSERLSARLGQQFLVENRVGASGAIGAEFVAKALPDGYTLFFAATPHVASVPLLQKVNYDPEKDFAPVSMVSTNPYVLGVHVSVPGNTLKEFVDYAKARRGKMNYASAGTGTLTHLTGALFLARAGLQMTHIPYKGGAPAVADLVGGQVHMYFGNASELIQNYKRGKIRLLGVSSENRAPQLPEVPAIAETYPGFRSIGWNGYLAPAVTPKAIIDQLSSDIAAIVREPMIANRLKSFGYDPVGNTPAEFAEFLRMDAPVWRDAVSAAGLKPE